jgi:HK97 family phage portal protein
MINTKTTLLERVFGIKKEAVKSDTFGNISLVESYDNQNTTIENVEDFYKLITKISAIPKSISEISHITSSFKYELVDEVKEKEIETIPPKIESLIKKPHVDYTYTEFISLMITDLLVSGNIYVYLEQAPERFPKVSLRRIDPRLIELGLDGITWTETKKSGVQVILDPKYLIHVKYTPDFNNTKFGMGIIAQNITLFTNIMKILQFRENFYKNGCIPTGIFSVKNTGALSETQIAKVIEEKYLGAKNAGKPLVLGGDVSYEKMQLDPSALKISDELILLYKEVLSVFGMPRYLMELGLRDTGQKYNNHAKQQEHFIKSTIVPIASKIEDVFTNVVKRIDERLSFKFKIDVEIYSEEALQKLSDAGVISPNEHRRLLSIIESEDDILDKHYMPSSKKLMSDVAEGYEPEPPQAVLPPANTPPPSNPPPAIPPAPPEPKKNKKPGNGQARAKTWRDTDYMSEPADGIWDNVELADKKNKRRIVQDFVNLNKKTRDKKSKEFTKNYTEYITLQYAGFMDKMKQHEKELERLTKPEDKAEKDGVAKYIGKIYKVKDEAGKITEVSMPLYQSVGDATYANTANILTVKIPFAITDPGVAPLVVLLREKTVLVAEATRNQIEEVVRRGIENNSTAAEVAKDMWRHFVDENKALPDSFTVSTVSGRRLNDRAVTIARNEVARANRLFSAESMKASGVVKSIRLVGLPDADGTCTPYFNQDFPHEMAGELSNIHVNCRCTIVPGEISFE